MYIDYENLIHFVIKVWTLEGRWDTGTNICQIWAQWAAYASCYLFGPNLQQNQSYYFHNIFEFGIQWPISCMDNFLIQKQEIWDGQLLC